MGSSKKLIVTIVTLCIAIILAATSLVVVLVAPTQEVSVWINAIFNPKVEISYNVGNVAKVDFDAINCGDMAASSTSAYDAFDGLGSSSANTTIYGANVTIGKSAFYDCSKLTSATFTYTDSWYACDSIDATTGTALTLANESTAATYLRSTYYSNVWKRIIQ